MTAAISRCEARAGGNNKHMPVLRSIAAAAHITSRHPNLIHQWQRTGQLTAACDIDTHEILVDLAEAANLSAAKPRRRPRTLTTTQR